MTISGRALGGFSPAEIPDRERPISEQFRIIAKQWCDAEAAADLLKETKTSVLAQMMLAVGDMPVSKAEMIVRASDDWTAHLKVIIEAKKEANLKKVHLEFLRIREREIDRASWTNRTEHKMGRSTP